MSFPIKLTKLAAQSVVTRQIWEAEDFAVISSYRRRTGCGEEEGLRFRTRKTCVLLLVLLVCD